MPKIIASYPAYDIVEAREHTLTGLPILHDGDTLSLKESGHLGSYTIGSVASSAIKDGECPFEARDRAVKFGHEQYFIFGNGATITAHQCARKTHIEVYIGMKVVFEGKIFKIGRAPNNNLKLVECNTVNNLIHERQLEVMRLQEEQNQ